MPDIASVEKARSSSQNAFLQGKCRVTRISSRDLRFYISSPDQYRYIDTSEMNQRHILPRYPIRLWLYLCGNAARMLLQSSPYNHSNSRLFLACKEKIARFTVCRKPYISAQPLLFLYFSPAAKEIISDLLPLPKTLLSLAETCECTK